MTKEYIKEAYEKLRKKLGRQPSKRELYSLTTVRHRDILQTFRTYSELVKEMGDSPKTFLVEKRTEDEFMIPYGEMVRELKRTPTVSDWIANKCKPVESSYKRRFGLNRFSEMAIQFREFANGKDEWKDTLSSLSIVDNVNKKVVEKESEECYVYLMFDTKTLCHKIGISNLPEWREKTLQSEKPSIKLIAAKKFVNRRIAANIEKALHESYSHRRKRGEWFQLDDEDVEEIKATLEN